MIIEDDYNEIHYIRLMAASIPPSGILYNMRVLITGASGMLGSAIKKELMKCPADFYLKSPSSSELNLLNIDSICNYLDKEEFDLIIHCAAVVGGIEANIEYPFEYLNTNVQIDSNIMRIAYKKRIQGFMYMASSCMYPAETHQPMSENQLMTGPLEKTNEGYALAKLVGTKTIELVSTELDWRAFIISNMYGPGDKYDSKHSHLVAAVIEKVYAAKVNGIKNLEMWGSGFVRREFTYVSDIAKFLASVTGVLGELPPVMNLGSGIDYSVHDYYKLICNEFSFTGEIVSNPGKPEGMLQKLMDVSLAKHHGWKSETDLRTGIHKSIENFLSNLMVPS